MYAHLHGKQRTRFDCYLICCQLGTECKPSTNRALLGKSLIRSNKCDLSNVQETCIHLPGGQGTHNFDNDWYVVEPAGHIVQEVAEGGLVWPSGHSTHKLPGLKRHDARDTKVTWSALTDPIVCCLQGKPRTNAL